MNLNLNRPQFDDNAFKLAYPLKNNTPIEIKREIRDELGLKQTGNGWEVTPVNKILYNTEITLGKGIQRACAQTKYIEYNNRDQFFLIFFEIELKECFKFVDDRNFSSEFVQHLYHYLKTTFEKNLKDQIINKKEYSTDRDMEKYWNQHLKAAFENIRIKLRNVDSQEGSGREDVRLSLCNNIYKVTKSFEDQFLALSPTPAEMEHSPVEQRSALFDNLLKLKVIFLCCITILVGLLFYIYN